MFPDKNHFGRIFYNQATMSAEGIPQVHVATASLSILLFTCACVYHVFATLTHRETVVRLFRHVTVSSFWLNAFLF